MGKNKRSVRDILYSILYFIVGTPRDSRRRKFARYLTLFFTYILLNVLLGRNITSRHYPWYANISVFLLLNINILLVLALFVALFRNFAKLLADRQKKIFGFKLQTKLVIFIVVLVTVPVFLTYTMSSRFIQDSIDRWYDANVRNLAYTALSSSENYQKSQLEDLEKIAAALSAKVQITEAGASKLIDEYIDMHVVDGMAVFGLDGRVVARQSLSSGITSTRVVNAVLSDGPVREYVLDDNIAYYWVGVPVKKGDTTVGALFAVKYNRSDVVKDMNSISEIYYFFQQLRYFSPPVGKAFKVSYFFIAMLIIFASIWGSMIFVRSITVPLKNLALAARRLSRGESDTRVDITGNDEITFVASSFNDMAEKLEIHTRQLQDANYELNEALNQISKDRQYIDTIYKNVDSAMVLFDKNMNVLKSNDRAKELMNTQNEQFQDFTFKIVTDFVATDAREHVQSVVFEDGDDSKHYMASITKIDNSEGELENILLVVDDNTHIMNMQRVTLWKEVASRLTHEIKNPLTPIKLTAERVKRRSKDIDDAPVRDLINKSMDMIITESGELLTLVEEFSIYARMPSLIREDLKLLELVQEVVELHKRLDNNVDILIDIADDIVITGDKHQIKRIFVNLIQNAIQAMDEQGGKITISAIKTKGRVQITVEDNGSGIKDEDIEKIFVPYFSKKPSGTGLGLAIVKKIIEEHGGKISVKSVSGEYTKFQISLPIK